MAACRVKEETERATMGSEEVGSIRAGLAPRVKRRAQEQTSRYPRAKIGGRGGRGGAGGGGGGWLEAQRERIEAQQGAAERVARAVAADRKKISPHDGSGASIPAGHFGNDHAGGTPGRSSRQNDDNDNNSNSHLGRGRIDGGAVGSGSAVGERPVHHSPSRRTGGSSSSVGVGGVGEEDGGVGCTVHAAAVEIVDIFLGDFVPKVPRRAAVTPAAAAASVPDGGDGEAGSASKKAPSGSKWAAIGRAGKLSARALAVCEVEVQTLSF